MNTCFIYHVGHFSITFEIIDLYLTWMHVYNRDRVGVVQQTCGSSYRLRALRVYVYVLFIFYAYYYMRFPTYRCMVQCVYAILYLPVTYPTYNLFFVTTHIIICAGWCTDTYYLEYFQKHYIWKKRRRGKISVIIFF